MRMQQFLVLQLVCLISFLKHANLIQPDYDQQLSRRRSQDSHDSRLEEAISALESRMTSRLQQCCTAEKHNQTIALLEKTLTRLNLDLDVQKEGGEIQARLIHHLQQEQATHRMELNYLRRVVRELGRRLEHVASIVATKGEDETEARMEDRENNGTLVGGDLTMKRTDVATVEEDKENGSESKIEATRSTVHAPLPIDCHDVYLRGPKYPGDYFVEIQPHGSKYRIVVRCNITRQSGWTLIQNRFDGSVDFYRTWDDYKKGFGNIRGEFWLGNDHIYRLTNQRDYRLRIEMTEWEGGQFWAEYDHFYVNDEFDNYRLHIHGYHGNAGDSLTSEWGNHNNHQFSTRDRDNDARFYDSCAASYSGGWWFTSCFESHLNGIYYEKGSHSSPFSRNGIQWNTINHHSSLKQVSMMIKPNDEIKETREDASSHVDNHVNFIDE